MNLDDLARFRELDTQGMAARIDALPDQLAGAWSLAQTLTLPDATLAAFKRVERIVIAANGTHARAAEIVATAYAGSCHLPILIERSASLPAYADRQNTLLILLSHTGNTPTTIQIAEEAAARGVQTHVISGTPGGLLVDQAARAGWSSWQYVQDGPPRTALGFHVILLIGLLHRLGLIGDPAAAIDEAVSVLRGRVPILGVESPVGKNPAKRLAGQMVGRIPVIVGGGIMAPVARRWKTQLNENAKTWAQSEELPEIDYNGVSGTMFPAPLMSRVNVVFLTSPQFDSPTDSARFQLTHDLYMQQGVAVDQVKGRGTDRLAQMLSAVQYGDYVSYYVAMAYEVDPTPTPAIEHLAKDLEVELARRAQQSSSPAISRQEQ